MAIFEAPISPVRRKYFKRMRRWKINRAVAGINKRWVLCGSHDYLMRKGDHIGIPSGCWHGKRSHATKIGAT